MVDWVHPLQLDTPLSPFGEVIKIGGVKVNTALLMSFTDVLPYSLIRIKQLKYCLLKLGIVHV